MSESTPENPKGGSRQPLTSAQEVVVDEGDEVDEAALEPLRICPRQVLESLGHLRIEKTRIKPIENTGAGTAGGNADVEAAILVPTQATTYLRSDNTNYVAIKKIRFVEDEKDDRILAPFAHEVKLLSNLYHANVVTIVGFVEDVRQGVAWMVFSWEKNGNLREFVRSANWELPELASLIGDVAWGLSYLHDRSPPICHGDLKSLNILVSAENRAIITDLGSARALDSTPQQTTETTPPTTSTPAEQPSAESLKVKLAESGELITMTGPAWTLRWAAPELVEGGSPGLASDIWAFGWICWEAVTGNFPFDEDQYVAVILRIMRGKLPPISDNALFKQVKVLCNLMEECWRLDANKRPSAMKCHQVISFMEQDIPSQREGDSLATTRSAGLLCALGRIQQNNAMMPEARKYFEKSLEVSKSVGDEWGKARSLRALGYVCYLQSDYAEAEEWYIQARNISSQIGDPLGLAESIDGLGDVHYMHNEYSKAEESYIQARSLYSENGSEINFAQSVKSLGDVCNARSEYAKAEELYIQARNIFSKLGVQLGFAQSIDSLGDLYKTRGEYSKAEELFIQARDIYSQIGNQTGFAHSVKSLGDVYRLRNDHTKAEESYIQARDIYSQVKDKLGFAESVKGLGDVYHMRSKYSEAEDSYVQARDTYSQIGYRLGVARSVLGLGEVYRMRDEYSKAEDSYIQAHSIFSQIGDQFWSSRSARGLGDVYRMQEEYSKAEESYIQAREISSQIADPLGSAQLLDGMGSLHTARGEYEQAEQEYLEAQQIYLRIGDLLGSANITWYLAWLHRDQARYDEAERLVREASTTYLQLGLEQEVADCNEFLDDIRPMMREGLLASAYTLFTSILRRSRDLVL